MIKDVKKYDNFFTEESSINIKEMNKRQKRKLDAIYDNVTKGAY